MKVSAIRNQVSARAAQAPTPKPKRAATQAESTPVRSSTSG